MLDPRTDDRVLNTDRIRNLRDFGGYPVAGGRIRRGLLFRSGHFAEATDSDLDTMARLGIAMQVDLRRPDEREKEPGRWSAPHLITSDGGREMTSPHLQFVAQLKTGSPDIAEGWMREYYRLAPFREHHVELFTGWFDALSGMEGDEAALVNCAAGKDRTGLLCAFTKLALGVSEADIVGDYMATNIAAQVEDRLADATAYFNRQSGADHPPEVYRPFLGVREDYLREAFGAIDAQAGGLDAYLTEVLGVGEDKRAALRRRLIKA